MSSDGVPQPGEVIVEKYRIERLIGQGGMGVVVAATHLQLNKTVALKFLLQGGARSPARAARFAREARIGATLSSDHAVRISDTGVYRGDIPFMVMEYLEGHDLSRHAAAVLQNQDTPHSQDPQTTTWSPTGMRGYKVW